MSQPADIHKAGGILLKGGKLLVCRSRGKDAFFAPGGKLEPGETAEDSLVRELAEEVRITVRAADFKSFGTFYASATGAESLTLRMDVFTVSVWEGEPAPGSEIEEIRWVGRTVPEGVTLGSIFEHEVIPRLAAQGLLE